VASIRRARASVQKANSGLREKRVGAATKQPPLTAKDLACFGGDSFDAEDAEDAENDREHRFGSRDLAAIGPQAPRITVQRCESIKAVLCALCVLRASASKKDLSSLNQARDAGPWIPVCVRSSPLMSVFSPVDAYDERHNY